MIGSDWPVCTLSAAYAETMAIVKDYIRQLDVGQQEQILGGNCARFYGSAMSEIALTCGPPMTLGSEVAADDRLALVRKWRNWQTHQT